MGNRSAYVSYNGLHYVDPSGYGFFAFLVAVIAWAITIAVTVDSFEQAADIRNEQKRAAESQQRTSVPSAPPVPTIGQRWNNVATNPRVAGTASAVAGFVPFAGEAQDYWAFRYGVDIFTTEQIPWGWRLGAGAALFIPGLGIVQIRHGARALNDVVSKGAKYVYDATVKRFRHVPSGRFVAGRNLPFPPNEGFRIQSPGTLKPGKMIDRYGSPHGGYASDVGASISSRGLPPGSEALEYHRYEVTRPLDVDMGPAAAVPDFAATGGTTQYRFGRPISELVEEGYLRER